MENNQTTVEGRQEKERQAFIEALRETPVITAACKRTGVGRATYYRWRQKNPQFLRQVEDAMTEGFELINDLSEGQIIALIKDKKLPAIALWLKTHHPRYGSKNHKSYAPIATPMELTPDEQKIMLEALALVSGNTPHNNNDRNNISVSGENPEQQKNSADSSA